MDEHRPGRLISLPAGSSRASSALMGQSGPLREPPWLDSWNPSQPVPVSADELRQLVCGHEVRPACAAEIAASIEPLVRYFARTLPPDWDSHVAGYYLDLLQDIPLDLLAKGVRSAMANCRFFPTVSEIKSPIEEELLRRQGIVRRLETALMVAQRDERRTGTGG